MVSVNSLILRIIFICIICLLSGKNIYSQSISIEVEGTVFLDDIPSQDAVVTLEYGLQKKSVISNQNGIYNFDDIIISSEIKAIKIKTSFLGYFTKELNVTLSEEKKFKIDVKLQSDSQDLDEVVIVNKKKRVIKTVNKLVYNVRKGDFIDNTEGAEVLNAVPTLSYEKSAGIKIDGNRNALVFMDGVETSTTELNLIDAKRIKSVEVVANPSAKYGAEFSGGIINVILRETDSLYYKGSLQIGKGILQKSTSLNPNFNIKTNKLNVNALYSYYTNEQQVRFDVLRNTDGDNNFYQQSSFRKPQLTQTSADINARYSLGDKDFIYVKGSYVLNDEEGIINGTFSNNDIDDASFSNDSKNSYTQYTLDGVFEKNIGNNLLSTRVRYTNYDKENFFRLLSEDEPQNSISTQSNFIEISGLFDYQINAPKILGESSQINVGVKYVDREYSYSDDNYFLDQMIFGTYFDTSFPVTDKISSFVSLYVEGVENQNDNFSDTSYFLLPSFSTNFDLSKKASIELSYSRRIRRPNAYDLNDAAILLNPGIAERGNQNLRPEIRNYASLRFGLALKGDSYLSLRPYYENNTDAILQSISEEDDILFYNKQNIGSVKKYGFSLGYNKTFFKKIRTNMNIGYIYNDYASEDLSNLGNTFYGNIFISTSFLKDKVEASLFSSWNTPKYTFITETRQNPFTSLSLRTNFLKNKVSASLTYSDLFRWASDIETIIAQNSVNQITDINSRFSNITVKLTYNFGDSFSSGGRVKTIRNSDVQN